MRGHWVLVLGKDQGEYNMLCFPRLGDYGYLGNAMFQYAALLGIANKTGFNPVYDFDKEGTMCTLHKTFPLTKVTDMPHHEQVHTITRIWKEPHFHFCEEAFSVKEGTGLNGYFQSEKYFINYKNNIIQEFTFKTEIKKNNLELQKMILNTNSILVHIRQHAFTETQKKQINEKNLLKSDQHTRENIVHNLKAIKYFKTKIDNAKFFVFSNDFKNLKNIFIGDEYYFVDQNIKLEPIYDFYLMTLCKHFIVSPSTFSWWAAWLSRNENKICISPPENMGMSLNRDIIPDDWINI